MAVDVAIVGIGEAQVGRFPDRLTLDIALSVAEEAIADSGLDRSDIDAVLTAPSFADPYFNTDLAFARLVDELGMRGTVKLNAQVNAGGSTGVAMLKYASGIVISGQARSVLCVHAEKFTSMSPAQGMEFFASAGTEREFEAPYGMSYNALPALASRRFMHETGTTLEQLAAVAVSCRQWASLNPNAMFRDPITVEDVLASKVITSPVTALMLNALGDGGSAFVVTSGEVARATTDTPVYLWGEGDAVNTYSFSQHADITRMGWQAVGEQAFRAAGIARSDIDIAEIYMAYPVFKLMVLEELGFCERGEGGEFVASGQCAPGGTLPMTTNGGALSYGHIGAGVGVATLVETARQLMGKAGPRQVADASIALEASAGGAYSDAHVTILSRERR